MQALRRWLERAAPDIVTKAKRAEIVELPTIAGGGLARRPAFCSGCPHNTSTVVPDGSIAFGGIGCHGMVAWMPERRTVSSTHMGGEGATWIGIAPFVTMPHIFQNMGDGTYFHSGYLCIRANVAAGTNITYKVLVNGAVAMTGGQPIEGGSIAGAISTPQIVAQLLAEGAKRVAVLSDHPEKYTKGSFPAGVAVHDRSELIRGQRELREIPGVTALVYDQTCAAEARRMRCLFAELCELALPVGPELGAHPAAHKGPTHGGGLCLELAERFGVLRRKKVRNGRDHLRNFHQRAFGFAERRRERPSPRIAELERRHRRGQAQLKRVVRGAGPQHGIDPGTRLGLLETRPGVHQQ